MAMVSCLLLFSTAYGILALVQQIGICRLKEKIRKGSDILEAGNYWRIYFADRKHLDIGCYYICKQLSYQRVVNSPRKTFDANSRIKPYRVVWYFYCNGCFRDCFNGN